jgi:hypothetical protein
MHISHERGSAFRNGAIFGLLTVAVAVVGAATGDALGEQGMLYRSGHTYDLPNAPPVGARHDGRRAQAEHYVARTMLVDGKPVGVDPYKIGEYGPLDAQYPAVEDTAYIPVDGWTSADSPSAAATNPQRGQATQPAKPQPASAHREAMVDQQIMVVRGTERSISIVEPIRQDIASNAPRQPVLELRTTRVGATTGPAELTQQSPEQSLGS